MPPKIDSSVFDRIAQGGKPLPVPGNFEPPEIPESDWDRAHREAGDQVSLTVVAVFQVTFLIGGAILWWRLGGALMPLGLGLLSGAVIAVLGYRLARSQFTKRPRLDRYEWLEWVGVALLSVFVSGLVGGLLQRIWQYLGFLLMALFVVGFTPLGQASLEVKGRRRLGWLLVGSAAVLAPFFTAWFIASLAWPSFTRQESLRNWLERQSPSIRAALSSRSDPARCANWIKDGEPIRVAVTLSGGGYRAALIHAGFLSSLDGQCVPVHLLSTVSGGSIIGASYAMGVPPAQFARQLAEKQPGLPADVIKMVPAMRDLLFPFWGNITATYTDHFRRVFFAETKLAELRDAPLLLLNVTDLQSGGDNAREVFFKGRAPAARFHGKNLDESLEVAQIVAASGAFPGAFRPATLPWFEPGADSGAGLRVKERQFVDGGVIDNLGVEGLRHYLTLPREGGKLPAQPHLLIISDASAYLGPKLMAPDADALTLLMRTTDYTYDLLHRHIYARYTGQGDLSVWVRSNKIVEQVAAVNYSQIDSRLVTNGGPRQLHSVSIPSTASVMAEIMSRYPQCRMDENESGDAVQKRVAGFATLYELSPRQVEEAFWLGRVMGQIFAPAIECARQKVLGGRCKTEIAQAISCPTRREVFD